MDQRVRSSSEDILAKPSPGGYSLSTEQRRSVDLADTINGWGSDLDTAKRPGVPRDKAPEIGVESLYPRIQQQVPKVKIHKSNEHGKLTPVFGTSCPPRGLSGRMRDAAYKYSEGKMAHWLMLMAADRVDVVEDVASDLARMQVPNLVKEMGLKSEWEYNRHGFITKIAVSTIAVAALMVLMRGRSRPD